MSEEEQFQERIKSGPYWRFVFRPEPFIESRVPIENLLPTVVKEAVRFRGWDFPHLKRDFRPITGTNYVSAFDDFYGHLEFWRMYQSGQFVYLSKVREASEIGWREKLERSARSRVIDVAGDFDWEQVPGFIDVINFVYTITEFFEFAARLAQALPRTESVKTIVGLHNIQGFVLAVNDPRRALWHYSAADEAHLENSWEFRLPTLISSNADLARDAMRWLLVRFGWREPNMEAIKKDMQDLMGRTS